MNGECEATAPEGPAGGEDGESSETDEDAPIFSLATGTYKTRRQFGNPHEAKKDSAGDAAEAVQALTLRNNDYTLAKLESAGSHYLTSRHFQGLEMREGMDEPAVLEEGRGGIARGYTEEK